MRQSNALLFIGLFVPLILPVAATGDETGAKEPAEEPITTARVALGDLLRKWYKQGSAAGNDGDYYDNRDRGHSGLRMGPYPQLTKITYTPQQLARRQDWAGQRVVLPQVVFGNSSTSASVTGGGSNVRQYYRSPRGMRFLYEQYTHNNIYIYPEHRDHDPGHNGMGGYGDLYPTNSPYLIASQGSSGSDQAFMRAIPFVLAALRPEVKKTLVERGLVAPTLQMILRMTGKNIADPKEYLTGKAHPTVFVGRNVDALKMVKMAHAIRTDDIPPMVQLKVRRETMPAPGRDYFDPNASERLADTPAVIARIVRGKSRVRRMTVSAETSYDVNKRPLKFHWVVLRGDPKRIAITPTNDAGSAAEIAVAWHERRPIAAGSAMESNRVDIGLFVHNGKHYSAPGFVTFYYPDDEARTYDRNDRLVEIGYNASTSVLNVSDWTALFALVSPGSDSWPASLLAGQFSRAELAVLGEAGGEYKTAHAALLAAAKRSALAAKARNTTRTAVKAAEKELTAAPDEKTKTALAKALAAAEEAAKQPEAEYRAARDVESRARGVERKVFEEVRAGVKRPIKAVVDRALARLVNDAEFFLTHHERIAALRAKADARGKAAVDTERKTLAAFGILENTEDGTIAFRTLPGRQRLTAYEKCMRARLNAVVLANLIYPEVVAASCKVNFVDRAIAAPKGWRDVYHYDADGNATGWTRYDAKRTAEFKADGLLIVERDARGRPVKTCKVTYGLKPTARGRRGRGEVEWIAAKEPSPAK